MTLMSACYDNVFVRDTLTVKKIKCSSGDPVNRDHCAQHTSCNFTHSLSICFMFHAQVEDITMVISSWYQIAKKTLQSSCNISEAAAGWLVCRLGAELFEINPEQPRLLKRLEPLNLYLISKLKCTKTEAELVVATLKPIIHSLESLLGFKLDAAITDNLGEEVCRRWFEYAIGT